MFKKHHAHFELPKAKVTTINLFHDFQGLHLRRRHFEHKSYNKHSNLKVENFNNWKNSFPNTFTLKLDTFKKLKKQVSTLEKRTTL